jgi:hypothetical protein
MLYSQGDIADEIYFVAKGSFTLYVDMASIIDLPDDLIDDTE